VLALKVTDCEPSSNQVINRCQLDRGWGLAEIEAQDGGGKADLSAGRGTKVDSDRAGWRWNQGDGGGQGTSALLRLVAGQGGSVSRLAGVASSSTSSRFQPEYGCTPAVVS